MTSLLATSIRTSHLTIPFTEIPNEWPTEYQKVVQRRIELIESDKNIALIERPEYKRRWNTEPWDEQQERALCGWLLDRLESYFDFDGRMNEKRELTARGDLREPRLTSVAKLADLAQADKDFMQVAEIFTGRKDFNAGALVADLVAAESVPALPILRYRPSGLEKRKAWERTWELQCREDEIDALFTIGQLLTADKKKPGPAIQIWLNGCRSVASKPRGLFRASRQPTCEDDLKRPLA